ncbi:hypothetical protein [Sporomusa aerivorans]|uniref:hypothetical protein n=1 Tax=Sporomusa aerivorans TaxID=204936 RepID=UPI00352A670B
MQKNKFLIALVTFIAVCIGIIAYMQIDKFSTQKRIEAEEKAQIEKIIKTNNENAAKGSPLKNARTGDL